MPEIRGLPFPFPHLSFLVENPPSSKKHEQLPTTARALILPIMNVTLQLPDDLCTAAQQREFTGTIGRGPFLRREPNHF